MEIPAYRCLFWNLGSWILIPVPVFSEDKSGDVRFNRDIRPILASRCFKCHGPDLKKGGLNLQDPISAARELKTGHTAVVPGRSEASELIRRVRASDESERMPPQGNPLTAKQIASLRAWIEQGAEWPDSLANETEAPPLNPKAIAMQADVLPPFFDIRPARRCCSHCGHNKGDLAQGRDEVPAEQWPR